MKTLILSLCLSLPWLCSAQFTIYSLQNRVACWNGEDYINCSIPREEGTIFNFSNDFKILVASNTVVYNLEPIYTEEKIIMYKVTNAQYNGIEYVIADFKNDLLKFLTKNGSSLIKFTIDRTVKNHR